MICLTQTDPGEYSPQQIEEQYRLASNQLQLIVDQMDQIQSLMSAIYANKSTIKAFEDEELRDLTIPLNGFISIKGTFTSQPELLVDIGSGVTVPSTPDEANKILEDMRLKLNANYNKFNEDRGKLEQIVQGLQYQLQQFYQQRG